jgi:hypothetical protein
MPYFQFFVLALAVISVTGQIYNGEVNVCCVDECFNAAPSCEEGTEGTAEEAVCFGAYGSYFASANGVYYRGDSDYDLMCSPAHCAGSHPDVDWSTVNSTGSCNCTREPVENGWYDKNGNQYECRRSWVHVSSLNKEITSRFASRRLTSLSRRDSSLDDGSGAVSGTCNVFATVVPIAEGYSVLLTVEGVASEDWVVVARKFQWSHVYHCSYGQCSFKLPFDVSVNSGPILFTVVTGTESCGETRTHIVGTNLCRSSDCIFCQNAFEHMKCLQPAEEFLLVFIFIMLFLMIVIMFPMIIFWTIWFIRMLVCLPWTVSWMAMKVYTSPFAKDSRKKWDAAREYMVGKDRELLPATTTEVQPEPVKKGGRSLPTWAIVGVVIALTIDSTQAFMFPCSASSVVAADYETCTTYGPMDEYRNCTMRNQMEITIPALGTSSCIDVYRETDAGNEVVATIEVTYLHAKDEIVTGGAYWTAEYSTSSCLISKLKSKGSAGCTGSSVCGRVSTNERPITQDFGGDACLYRTENQYGCSWCSGGSNDEGCAMWAYGITPISWRYQVRNMISQTLTPTIRINITDQLGVSTVEDLSITATQRNLGKYLVQALGNLNRNTINLAFSGLKVVRREGSPLAWIAPASPTNSPTRNMIGDIQAVSSAALVTGAFSTNVAEFIYAQDLITPQNNCPSPVTFVVSTPGIRQLSVLNDGIFPLPHLQSSDLWVWNPTTSKLTANVSAPPAVVVSLTLSDGLHFSIFSAIVCPQFTIVNATGCSNCNQGFLIIIEAVSTCSGGPVDVSLNDNTYNLNTPVVTLTRSNAIYEIRGFTPFEETTFLLTLRNGEFSQSESVYIVTPSLAPNLTDSSGVTDCSNGATCVNSTKQTKSEWRKDLKPGGFADFFKSTIPDFFKGIFDGLGSGVMNFLMVVIMLVMVAIGFMLLKAMYSMIATNYPDSMIAKLSRKVQAKKSD